MDYDPLFSHNTEGCKYLKYISSRYGLNFVPYLLQAEVRLLYGSNLLKVEKFEENKKVECVALTKKIPFSFAPKWYEWLEFPGNIDKKAFFY